MTTISASRLSLLQTFLTSSPLASLVTSPLTNLLQGGSLLDVQRRRQASVVLHGSWLYNSRFIAIGLRTNKSIFFCSIFSSNALTRSKVQFKQYVYNSVRKWEIMHFVSSFSLVHLCYHKNSNLILYIVFTMYFVLYFGSHSFCSTVLDLCHILYMNWIYSRG